MAKPARFKQGDIYWVSDCPALDGGVPKRRPVIIIASAAAIDSLGQPLLLVAVSTTVRESEPDRIELPSLETEPQTKTGLPKRCWVVPRWYFAIERHRLTDKAGFISGRKLGDILAATTRRMSERRPES